MPDGGWKINGAERTNIGKYFYNKVGIWSPSNYREAPSFKNYFF